MRPALRAILIAWLATGCASSVVDAEPVTVVDEEPATAGGGEEPASAVEWIERRRSIVCRATGTEIPLPSDASLLVREAGDAAVLVVRGGPVLEGALLVDQGRGEDGAEAARVRWAHLHELVTGAPLGDLAVTAEIFRSERGASDIIAADYEVAGEATRYRLAFRSIQRNGATCRIAVLERLSDTSGALASVLDGIVDSPGLEIPGPSVRPARDTTWDTVASTVDGVLAVASALGALLR